MFFGGYVETSSTDTIDVPDVDPDAFMSLLKYLYCDEIDLNPDNVLATLYAAKKVNISYSFRHFIYKLSTFSFELFRLSIYVCWQKFENNSY